MSSELIEIKRLPRWRIAALSVGGKKRNKRLLIKLQACNLALAGRGEILSALNLGQAGLSLLTGLARLEEGWHVYKINPGKKDDESAKLAKLGLVFLSWPGEAISLSDAGRFLLSLMAEPR